MSEQPYFSPPFVLSPGETRSISAENPTGARSGGAQAAPGDDHHCTDASRLLGKGWKVRPCLRNIAPGDVVRLADVAGPGVVQHIWCTVDAERIHGLRWRVTYDARSQPAIDVPLGFFFANGVNGIARIASQMIAVNPRGGMNSYWPMPFRNHLRIELVNDGPDPIKEFFYQITYALQPVAPEAAYLHARFADATTSREHPEHVILDRVSGDGQYVATYLVWRQYTSGWWGEGEVKFFIDDDPAGAPTICGTGTEDYFGGAWCFLDEPVSVQKSVTFAGPFLGYPQVSEVIGRHGEVVPIHAMYRWHVPDPIRFRRNLRVTIQALGWCDETTFAPLEDDLASLALWYQRVHAS